MITALFLWCYLRDIWLYVKIYGLRYSQDIMSQKSAAGKCLTWIADEQYVHETADYGSNANSVQAALQEQRRRVKLINDYERNAVKVTGSCKDEKDKAAIKAAYSNLTDLANHRLQCLEGISHIAELENAFGTLSVAFADKATKLVSELSACSETEPSEGGKGNSAAIAAQNCILSVRSNWSWLSTLAKCTDTHLQHVSDYHQFFHEIKEYGRWMPAELQKAQDKCDERTDTADEAAAKQLVQDIKDLLSVYQNWQAKVDRLLDRGKRVVPVHLRTTKPDHNRPVIALCNYATHEVNVREGEEMVLLDNSKPENWQVRNMHSVNLDVPSIVLVIPGPDPAAVQAATRLRLQLLGSWTLSLKQFGKTMIKVMLLVFRDWTTEEKEALRSLKPTDKQTLLAIADYIETTLSEYWSEYGDFNTLKHRLVNTRTILKETGTQTDASYSTATKERIESMTRLRELLQLYQEFWSSWETYRLLMETASQPEFLLILERWEQLKLVEILPLLKKWHSAGGITSATTTTTTTTTHDSVDAGETKMIEEDFEMLEQAQANMLGTTSAASNGTEQVVCTEHATRHETESSQLSTSEQQENKTFVITGVLDPRNGDEVSMQQAVMLGIIDSQNGLYVNPETGETIPIPVAMTAGKIKVEFTQTKKTSEKRRDIGLITIRTHSESRPYTVKQVIDAKTEEKVSVDEAIARGVLDQKNGIYHNTATGSEMTLSDALNSELLIVEFDTSAPVTSPESVEVTYAIHSVVDVRKREKVTFSNAVRLGLIDTKTGAFHNNRTGEDMYVGDAIKKGFIKAKIVNDPSQMDIDAENKLFVDKVAAIKSKLLTPIRAISALKKAVEYGKLAAGDTAPDSSADAS